MKPDDTQRRDAVLKVCELFYVQGRNHQQIAEELGFSRWKVSRLLEVGRNEGFVQVRVHDPYSRDGDLEAELLQRYSLEEAVVVRDRATLSQTIGEVCAHAAQVMVQIRPNPEVVGISWGNTMARVASCLGEGWADHPTVVQLNGGIATLGKVPSAAQTVVSVAKRARGQALVLPCPAIVGSPELATALSQDPAVANVLEHGKKASVALYSLGALRTDSVLVEAGCLTRGDATQLRAKGGVGDILGHFINGVGQIVDPDWEARTIGLSIDDLKKVDTSIAVAVGLQKSAITRAALLGGYPSILITSQSTAREVLRETDPK
ncbi:MAG: sugar-binding transcriptional regulator [Ancrocorticia sp.]|uniref:sugar-binding transcriptional regulator n=1 Tax=Ancrocorticia sp. TaxID=2593684 RepID=UPI003F8E50A0